MKLISLATVSMLTFLCGCVSTVTYKLPVEGERPLQSIEVKKPLPDVWKNAVAALAARFFVINNLDQASGFMNLSYSGDPEQYVDCGDLAVQSPGAAEGAVFPAARASVEFLFFTSEGVMRARRQVSLDGRINLVFAAISPESTRVTVHVRYVLERTMTMTNLGGVPRFSDRRSVSFSAGEPGRFPATATAELQQLCRATGRLERELLDVLR